MAYDEETGHFTLTISMVRLWLRVDDAGLQDTEAIADRLRECGIAIHEIRPAWVRCDMRPGAIWEALRGERPEPPQIVHYWTHSARQRHPQWAAEELHETAHTA